VSGPDERETYRGLLKGDQATFDRFFAEYFPPLYHFVLTRVGDDAGAAQALCQQALIRGLTRFASYRGDAPLFTWLCRIAEPLIDDGWLAKPRGAAEPRLATQSLLTRAHAAFREGLATLAVPGDGGHEQ